jgi:hypothetical protein
MAKKKTDNDDLTGEITVVVKPMTLTAAEIGIMYGVPVTQKGGIDLFNHVPNRFIPLETARAQGLTAFWEGKACRYGHQAARFVSNTKICMDCRRAKMGLEPIYPRSAAQKFHNLEKKPTAADPNTASAASAAPAPQSLGLDTNDTKFLAAYAEHRDLDKAAKSVGTTKELILARRVGFPGLDEAMTRLEQQLEIPKYMPAGAGFVWTDEARELFITTYINSGEIADARQAVGCTRAQFFTEQKQNLQFAQDVEAAKPLAESVVEEAFTKAAKAGQQSILPRYFEILEARAAQRMDIPSDPKQSRATVEKILADIKKDLAAKQRLLGNVRINIAAAKGETVCRVKSTGEILLRQHLEPVLRDMTGALYRADELEDVDARSLSDQHAAARASAVAEATAEVSEVAEPSYDDAAPDKTPDSDESGNI